ncbi:MAG: aminopeptidase [Gammaproteobacteria bacterium]|nr:aminopeptidase [Gammaproteobacteria bacterium]
MKLKPRFLLLIIASLALLSACADLSYYLHSVNGHYDIMNRTRPIPDWMQDASTDPELVEKLSRIARIRDFAMNELALPESNSYTLYADIGRNYVVKNLIAAEEFSIRPYQWCYPVVGCMGYRGYFDEQRLERFRQRLQDQGFDIYVTRVTAYSTLGWFDDPVLNTFIDWPEYRLAGLIFHELAHQQLYVDGDTPFNESFAMAVQHAGVERWLQAKDQTEQLQRYRQYLQNRQQVTSLIESARQDLGRLYQTDKTVESMRQAKQDRLQRLKSDYAELTAGFEVKDGFKYWFDGELNNAKLASVSAYHAQEPAFRARLEQLDGNFPLFYQQVAELSRLPSDQRSACLQGWMLAQAGSEATTACP